MYFPPETNAQQLDQLMTEKLYTEAEATLLADRGIMNVKMTEMAHRIESTERATKEGFSDVKIQLSGLATTMEKQFSAEDNRREVLKADLAKEFATKMEVQVLAHKVDSMWIKITVVVSTVIAVAMFLQYVLMTTDKARILLGAATGG
jgi:uncharacterized membrane protein